MMRGMLHGKVREEKHTPTPRNDRKVCEQIGEQNLKNNRENLGADNREKELEQFPDSISGKLCFFTFTESWENNFSRILNLEKNLGTNLGTYFGGITFSESWKKLKRFSEPQGSTKSRIEKSGPMNIFGEKCLFGSRNPIRWISIEKN